MYILYTGYTADWKLNNFTCTSLSNSHYIIILQTAEKMADN